MRLVEGLVCGRVASGVGLLGALFGSVEDLECSLGKLILLCCRDVHAAVTTLRTSTGEELHDVGDVRMHIDSAPGELDPEPSLVVVVSGAFLVIHRNHLVLLCLVLGVHLLADHVNDLLSHNSVVKVETLEASNQLA